MKLIGMNAIVVDDDPDITGVFSELLTLHGVDVIGIGHNGFDAIRLFSEKSPMLVFLDVHMPQLDGITALKKIKELSAQVKVIMVTGDLSSDLEKILESNGANAIIFKPFSIDEITYVINEIQTSDKMITRL